MRVGTVRAWGCAGVNWATHRIAPGVVAVGQHIGRDVWLTGCPGGGDGAHLLGRGQAAAAHSQARRRRPWAEPSTPTLTGPCALGSHPPEHFRSAAADQPHHQSDDNSAGSTRSPSVSQCARRADALMLRRRGEQLAERESHTAWSRISFPAVAAQWHGVSRRRDGPSALPAIECRSRF